MVISFAEPHFAHYDFAALVAAAEAAAKRSSVPVALFLDHGAELESAVAAIRNGFNGVMAAASHLAFDDNVAATRAVVDMAHAVGVPVEGELGYVPGVEGEDALRHPGDIRPTSPAEAARYVQATGVDFLAVSVGTVHGRMRGVPHLDLDRLDEIAEAVAAPLVIHGGTGLADAQFRALAERGVAKINYYCTATTDAVRDAVAADVARTCEVFGAAGRAAAALHVCRHWPEVVHLILFNWSDGAAGHEESFEAAGRRTLAAVPGVRRVELGQALRADARHRRAWSHPAGEHPGRGRLHGAPGSPGLRGPGVPASRRRSAQDRLCAGLNVVRSCTIALGKCRPGAACRPAPTDAPTHPAASCPSTDECHPDR